jgi:hypothetical protein
MDAVDPASELFDLLTHFGIVSQCLPGRYGDLDQSGGFCEVGLTLEKKFVCPEPHIDPFRVVEAIGPEDDLGRIAEFVA